MTGSSSGRPSRSWLCVGRVMHQRLAPLRHRLSYGVFQLLLDVDELPALSQRLRLFSLGRFNLFALHPRDYLDGSAEDASGLRAQVERRQREAGLPTGGRLRLLTLPRVLGYAFNPLSVWLCDAPGGGPQAVIYEVNNTFGQRHSYLIPVEDVDVDVDADVIEQRCDKRLYVSPFLGMDLHYRFRLRLPGEDGATPLSLGIAVHDAEQAVLHARLDARPRPLGDAALVRVLFTHPLLTLKVIVGIHWEAWRLWRKGARLQPRPDAPERPLTIVARTDPP